MTCINLCLQSGCSAEIFGDPGTSPRSGKDIDSQGVEPMAGHFCKFFFQGEAVSAAHVPLPVVSAAGQSQLWIET